MAGTLTDRIAAVVDKYAYSGGTHGHHDAAVRILAEPDVVDALRAADVVRALNAQHQPRRWADGSDTVVCDVCNRAYPCPTRDALDGAVSDGQPSR